MPTEKYAHAPEILEHCQRIGKQFGLYDNALFHTEVTDLEWDDEPLALDHPHQPRRRVHRAVPRHGHRPAARARSCRASPASRTFAGHSFHTSRWDYDYTGGDPSGAPMDKLADKRVGDHRHRRHRRCSASPTSPRRAGSSTSSSARRRRSTCATTARPTPSGSPTIATPGWQQRWLENFTANQTGGMAEEDLVHGRLDRPRPPHPRAGSWRCRRRSSRPRR